MMSTSPPRPAAFIAARSSTVVGRPSASIGVQLLEAFGREVVASTYGITHFSTIHSVGGVKQLVKSLRGQIEVAQRQGPLARAQEFQDRISAVVSETLDATTLTSEELRDLDPYTLKGEDHVVHPEIPVFAHMHPIR